MAASPVGVDRPVEGQELPGDVVDDGLRLDLDELDPTELGRVEGPPSHLEQLVAFHRCNLEHVFDRRQPGKLLNRARRIGFEANALGNSASIWMMPAAI